MTDCILAPSKRQAANRGLSRLQRQILAIAFRNSQQADKSLHFITADALHTVGPSEVRQQQRQFINDARALLRPSPVDASKMPAWFRSAMLKAFRGEIRFGCLQGWAVIDSIRRHLSLTWLDHTGQTNWYGRPAFVSEPYDLDAEKLASIEKFAATLGCEWRLSPNSHHYPGSTLRIVFFEKREEESQPE